jgi:flagellar hook-associated protein 2
MSGRNQWPRNTAKAGEYGLPITFSGFNNIDFNLILESVMKQARGPLTAIEDRQAGFKAQLTNLGKLTSQTNALRQAADDLADSKAGDTVTASTTDATAVGVSSGSGAVAGRYDIVVQELARAQTTASATTLPDPNTTVAATACLGCWRVTVTVTGSVTLQELATDQRDRRHRRECVGRQSRSGAYKLVSRADTGADASFTVTNGLTGSTLTFGANAVDATDASILVNNVQAISATNTFDSAVPGVTLTVLKKDPAETIGINVTSSPAALKARLDTFVKHFNDVIGFFNDQQTAQARRRRRSGATHGAPDSYAAPLVADRRLRRGRHRSAV